MKCIRCGQEMYSVGISSSDTVCGNYVKTKYVCPKCGYEASENFNDLVYSEPFSQPDIAKINYGWICPKCGAVLSPSTKECPHCTPYTATCGPNSKFPIVASLTSNVTSQAQNNITATINDNLRAKENMKGEREGEGGKQ